MSTVFIFHLAHQNLRRLSNWEVPVPGEHGGPTRLHSGDGYDAARVLLLDPSQAEEFLIAIPERDTLYLGREEDRPSMISLMATEKGDSEHPVSHEVYRLRDQQLVPIDGSELR